MKNKYTPAQIAQSDISFSIPIYQRLFEWGDDEVGQLLNDLYLAFQKSLVKPERYYIGMLTVYANANRSLSLVDGQQRFTVLTLMAIAFDLDQWKPFLATLSAPRLDFFGRTHDKEYLRRKMSKLENGHYINKKMEAAISCITEFVSKMQETQRLPFQHFIFNNATFFISELPQKYDQQDLNRHFEKMNSVGKSLENHEILKVNLLKHVDDKEFYNRLWNCVSQMDKTLIRQKTRETETVQDYRRRSKDALESIDRPIIAASFCNDFNKVSVSSTYDCIAEIRATSENPAAISFGTDQRAILTFSEFLLQVLWIDCQNEKINKTEFFNVHKLQQTFKAHLLPEKTAGFLNNLLKYRLIFDHYVPRVVYNESQYTDYILSFGDNEKNENYSRLLKFMSMQYVSTVSYRWLTPILIYLNDQKNISVEDYLKELKRQDNSRHAEIPSLTYHSVDRYWFWRLDYYLWENRNTQFRGEQIRVAENYVFRQNRSIEHVAPQKPKGDSSVIVSENRLHSFGNLCMISGGLNSSLQNEAFEIKKAHVQTYISGSKSGTIESLKMLKLYDYSSWNDFNIEDHDNLMVAVLRGSFNVEDVQKCEKITN